MAKKPLEHDWIKILIAKGNLTKTQLNKIKRVDFRKLPEPLRRRVFNAGNHILRKVLNDEPLSPKDKKLFEFLVLPMYRGPLSKALLGKVKTKKARKPVKPRNRIATKKTGPMALSKGIRRR